MTTEINMRLTETMKNSVLKDADCTVRTIQDDAMGNEVFVTVSGVNLQVHGTDAKYCYFDAWRATDIKVDVIDEGRVNVTFTKNERRWHLAIGST